MSKALIISRNDKFKLGYMVEVYNKERVANSSKSYYVMQVKYNNSDYEPVICMFTKNMLGRYVNFESIAPDMKLGEIYYININNKRLMCMKYIDSLKVTRTVILNKSCLDKAIQRANKNLEDIPKNKKILGIF